MQSAAVRNIDLPTSWREVTIYGFDFLEVRKSKGNPQGCTG